MRFDPHDDDPRGVSAGPGGVRRLHAPSRRFPAKTHGLVNMRVRGDSQWALECHARRGRPNVLGDSSPGRRNSTGELASQLRLGHLHGVRVHRRRGQ